MYYTRKKLFLLFYHILMQLIKSKLDFLPFMCTFTDKARM